MQIPKAPANLNAAQYRKWLKNFIVMLQHLPANHKDAHLRDNLIAEARDELSEMNRRARFNG